MNKVVLIGCGNVGLSYAYTLLNQNKYVNELVLLDVDTKRVKGEVMDLTHCLPYTDTKINIKAGSYKDVKDACLVVICAGANQKKGETRMDLINKNSSIFKTIINNVMQEGFDGIFLVATNPLDVMTYLTYKYSKLPCYRVIGSGTVLDTARLKLNIGNRLNINPKNINGYVIGEHGDSEFIPWSHIKVASENINEYFKVRELNQIEREVRESAYKIINLKGNTSYGIGISLVKITNAILGDEKIILTVSNLDPVNKVYVGMPAIVGRKGILKKVYIELNKGEEDKLQKSIDTIKEAIKKVK